MNEKVEMPSGNEREQGRKLEERTCFLPRPRMTDARRGASIGDLRDGCLKNGVNRGSPDSGLVERLSVRVSGGGLLPAVLAFVVSWIATTSLCGAVDLRLAQVASIELPTNARTLAWHPDSRTLAAGGWSGMLTIWDARTGKLIRDLRQPDNVQLGEIEYSRDGKFFAVAKSNPGLKQAYLSVFDATTYELIEQLQSPRMLSGEKASLKSLSIDPTTTRKIALSSYTNGRDPAIFVVGNAAPKVVQFTPEAGQLVETIAFSPTGKFVAVGHLNSTIYFYSAENGQLINSLTAFQNIWWLSALSYSPDGKYIFAASNTGAGREWLDKATGKWVIHKNNEPIKMWDVQTQSLVRTFDTQGRGIETVAITPDSRFLIAGLAKGFIAIWNIATGAEIWRFRPFANSTIVNLSLDGKYLAAADTGTSSVKIFSFSD